MNKAYLLTGSNLGERAMNLARAWESIRLQCGRPVKTSALFETAPWGNNRQPAFLNQAVVLETTLTARQLLRRILKIEQALGRVREEKYGPRLIDIDILLYGDEIHQYDFLKLPHPEMQNRRFALQPLASIAPDVIHPVFKKTISELLAECNDPLPVKIYN
jgi:2-amino-4-hydroxy-6-hydroxymethyldihydropteridine diphosphokinase